TLTYVESFYSEEYEETRHIIYGSPDNQMTFDDKDEFTIVMQLPKELSHLLEDSYVIDNLQGNGGDPNRYGKFGITGTIGDTEGEERSISRGEYGVLSYVTANPEANSIEFVVYNFMVDNECDLEDGIRYYSYEIPLVVREEDALYNGTYTFKPAGVDKGSG